MQIARQINDSLKPSIIEYRMRETSMETDERARAKQAFQEDRSGYGGKNPYE